MIDLEDSISVTPGETQIIPVDFQNNGNTQEELDVTAVIEGNWTNSWQYEQITIPIDGTISNELTVEIPALGGEYTLENGDIHKLTISLYETGTNDFLASRDVDLIVAPIFIVEIENWPEIQYFHTGMSRTWDITLTNVGNKEVTVDLDYDIFKPGQSIGSIKWEVDSGADQRLTLPIGTPINLRFDIISKDFNSDIFTSADFVLTITPDDEDVSGVTIVPTTLEMSRLFSYKDYELEPEDGDPDLTEEIYYEFIPGPAGGDEVEFLLELCDATRRVNLTQLGLAEEDFVWSFGIDVGTEVKTLNMSNDCDGGDHSNAITLPNKQEYEYLEVPLMVVIDAPDRPNILKNDGFDLTFRLYHPDEHSNYEQYTNATFSFYFDTVSIPNIVDLEFKDGELLEGVESSVTATLRNDGTSLAAKIKAELVCEGIEVEDPVYERDFLADGETVDLEWDVTTESLDWWAQSSEVTCNVELTATAWNNEPMPAKNFKLEGEVESWSPNIGISFIATLGLITLSVILLRLVGQNDKFRLAATYSGVLALGFAFHLLNLAWWGPLVLLTAAGWVWAMTWRSTVEFQLIHEDYQRARKGVSTLYSDHYEVLSNAKRQLSIILAMPVLGMIGVILGIPPQFSQESDNIMTLAGYLLVVVIGVVFLIWNANRLYGSLYGRLTEVEIQASKIERDLGDPARLLTELASDGLDISSLISAPKPNVAAEGDASPVEVSNWDEELSILEDDNDSDLQYETDQESMMAEEDPEEGADSSDMLVESEPEQFTQIEEEQIAEEQIEESSESQESLIGLDIDDLFTEEEEVN